MALSFDQISSITQKKYIPKLVDNVFDSNPLLKRSKEKGWHSKIDGGQSVVIPLNYAQVSASDWYTGAETLSTEDNDVITAAEYQWKQLYANITISRADELKNMGEAQVLDFVKSKVQIAEKTMMDKLGTGLYSAGTNAKSIIGLRSIVGTANSVGGIDQASYSWWQGRVDSSTTATSMAALQTQYALCTIGNDHPTVLTSGRSPYNFYYALLQPQQRFQDAETAKGGFTSLMFNGTPWIVDSQCPSAHIFMLNENYLHLKVHKEEDMRFQPFQSPTDQNVKIAKIYWFGIFGSSNNRMHAKFSAIAS